MANAIFIEPLEDDEIIFINRRYEKASKDYMRVMNFFLIACGVFPLLIATFFGLIAFDLEVFIRVFIISIISLISFFIIVASIYYFLQIFNKYRDVKYKTKTIENCLITEKKSMPLNSTFHFFINSKVEYSIELSEADFNSYEEGDEINIEYTTYDKEYLGYF